MDSTTYSFADVSCVMQHSLVGQKSVNGLGIGKITVAFTDNLTQSDLGADGNVMISKIASRRGTITFDIQQTSEFNKWLANYANAVQNASSSYWAAASIAINEKFDGGINTNATKVSLQKRPDRNDGQNGDHVTWVLESANIVQS
jgi:hypothetical protein